MDERDRRDWLKAGYAGLVHELRGELRPEEVATRAASFLARYLDAPAAAIYHTDTDGSLHLLGHYAGSFPGGAPTQLRFRPGEGLVGQAALQDKIMVVTDLPPTYLRVRSALGEGAPNALVLLPLMQFGKCTGVLELAARDVHDFAAQAELVDVLSEDDVHGRRYLSPTYGRRAISRARFTATATWRWWRRHAPLMRR